MNSLDITIIATMVMDIGITSTSSILIPPQYTLIEPIPAIAFSCSFGLAVTTATALIAPTTPPNTAFLVAMFL